MNTGMAPESARLEHPSQPALGGGLSLSRAPGRCCGLFSDCGGFAGCRSDLPFGALSLPAQTIGRSLGELLRIALVAAEERDAQADGGDGGKAPVQVFGRVGGHQEQRQRRPDRHGERLSEPRIAQALAQPLHGQHVGGRRGRGGDGGRKAHALQAAEHRQRHRAADERRSESAYEQDGCPEHHDDDASPPVDQRPDEQARGGGRHGEDGHEEAGIGRRAAQFGHVHRRACVHALRGEEAAERQKDEQHEHARPQARPRCFGRALVGLSRPCVCARFGGVVRHAACGNTIRLAAVCCSTVIGRSANSAFARQAFVFFVCSPFPHVPMIVLLGPQGQSNAACGRQLALTSS